MAIEDHRLCIDQYINSCLSRIRSRTFMPLCTVCTAVLQEQHLSRDLELLLERMESPAWHLAPQQDIYKAQHLAANKGHTAHHYQVKLFSSSCHICLCDAVY